MLRTARTTLAIIAAATLLAACDKGGADRPQAASGAQPRTLQLAHVSVENEDDMYHHLAAGFAERVARHTNGAVKVQVLGGAQMGGERDVAEGMQLGSIDMSVIASFALGAFEKKAMVFDLPYLFKDYPTAFQALDSSFTDGIEADLERTGLKVLGWGHGGFRNLYNSKQPVRTLADLKDMKVRMPENPIYVDTWRALGVNVTSMAYPELFTGLQQRTIDGAENPTALYYTSRFYEAAKYLSKTEHVYVAIPIVVSARVWTSLAPEQQAAFQKAADEAIAAQRQFLLATEAATEKKLAEAGVAINSDVDKAAFRRAAAPVYERYKNTIDPELVTRAQALAQ